MIDLNQFGKIIRTYFGSGELCLEDKKELRCSFKVAQLSDGRLYAACEILTSDFSIVVGHEVESLSGRTNDGKYLDLQQLFTVSTRISSSQKGASEDILLSGSELSVSDGTFPEGPAKFNFFITNLNLGSMAKRLSLTLDGFAVIIRSVQSYDQIVGGLKAIQVDITWLLL